MGDGIFWINKNGVVSALSVKPPMIAVLRKPTFFEIIVNTGTAANIPRIIAA
jgi:hypothetical protein